MATGILSIGLQLIGYPIVSRVALGIAAAIWLLLAAGFGTRLAVERDRWIADAGTPAALTGVAATTLIGTRVSLLGWQTLAAALLALAMTALVVLIVPVIRRVRRPATGSAFLICVAPQGIAVLAATLAAAGQGRWLAPAALGLFCAGVVLYLWTLTRFDFRQVCTGAGDHWVLTGAVAISALAAAKLTAYPPWTGTGHTALRTVTLVLVAIDLLGYVVLAVAEIRWPRPRFDVRRWATVFPLGMSGAAVVSAVGATGVDWLHGIGSVLLWIAVAAWLTTGVYQVVTLIGPRPPKRPGPVPVE